MEELIKEAEKLYKNIDDIQLMWVKSTKDSYEEGKIFAIGLMHATMNSVSQFLKCLIDSKDNIVDLGEVWHDISVEPRYDNKRLVFENRDGFITYCSNKSKALKIWNTWKNLSLGASIRWAYFDDLLPKGDNK